MVNRQAEQAAGPHDLPSQPQHALAEGQTQCAQQCPAAHGRRQKAERIRAAPKHLGRKERQENRQRHGRQIHAGQNQHDLANRREAEGIAESLTQLVEDVLRRMRLHSD